MNDKKILTVVQRLARLSSAYEIVKAEHEGDQAESLLMLKTYVEQKRSLGLLSLAAVDYLTGGDQDAFQEETKGIFVWMIRPNYESAFEYAYHDQCKYASRDKLYRAEIKHDLRNIDGAVVDASDIIEEEMYQVFEGMKVSSEIFEREFSVEDFIETFVESITEGGRRFGYYAVDLNMINSDLWKKAYGSLFSRQSNTRREKKRRSYSESFLGRLSHGLERIFITDNLTSTSLQEIDQHIDRYEARKKIQMERGSKNKSLMNDLIYASDTPKFQTAEGEESTWARSLNAVNSLIFNLEQGFFPGEYVQK